MSRRGERAMVPDATPTSYYGRPVLKVPVWRWPVPAYFFTGGLAAGSTLLAAGARLSGDRRLATRSRMVALAGIGLSGMFLVEDLGRPERFLHMLRVAKPTSPMSMGSWLLAAYGPATAAAVGCDLLGRPAAGAVADAVAAALAPAVAGYTAVLVANTAVPVWHEARHTLPFVFVSGAAASAGALAVATTAPSAAGAVRRVALAGAAGKLLSTRIMEHHLGDLARPYREGRAGRMARASTACTAAGAGVIALAGRKRRGPAVAGAALLLAGAALQRFAVLEAGKQSARDPVYTVAPQRQRLQARTVAGAARPPR